MEGEREEEERGEEEEGGWLKEKGGGRERGGRGGCMAREGWRERGRRKRRVNG